MKPEKPRQKPFQVRQKQGASPLRVKALRRLLGYSEGELARLKEGCGGSGDPDFTLPQFPASAEWDRRKRIYQALETFRHMQKSCLPALYNRLVIENAESGIRTREHYADDPAQRDAWGKMSEAKEKYYEAVRWTEAASRDIGLVKQAADAVYLYQEAYAHCRTIAAEFEVSGTPLPEKRARKVLQAYQDTARRAASFRELNRSRTKIDMQDPQVQRIVNDAINEIFSKSRKADRTWSAVHKRAAIRLKCAPLTVRNALRRQPDTIEIEPGKFLPEHKYTAHTADVLRLFDVIE